MFNFENIFVNKKLQKKKKKLEQDFIKKKITENKEIEIENKLKNKKRPFI